MSARPVNRLTTALLTLAAAVLVLPVVAIFAAWLRPDASTADLFVQLLATVLPDYTATTLWLCTGVALGVTVLGCYSALLVTLFDFPGRRILAWALLLPMAMPAYVVAYAYTDFFQPSSPLMRALQAALDLPRGALPDVRSLGGAVLVFTLTLYPYVYLLVRAALLARAARLLEAAHLLGAGLTRRILTIALPMARPAIAAGVALVLMETLADFGVSSYFGIQTYTAGIYKAWLVLDDANAASQLASLLLVFVLVLLVVEQRAQQRMRFASSRPNASTNATQPQRLSGLPGLGWIMLGTLPVLLGFVLPTVILIDLWLGSEQQVAWQRFADWCLNSLRLGGITAVLAVGLSLALLASKRLSASRWLNSLTQLVSLGYAIPGAVVVVGILMPLRWFQDTPVVSDMSYWVTATSLGIVWAYLVRFCAVAMQSLSSGYARLPQAMDESSKMLGVTGFKLFKQVHLPNLRPSVYLAALLVFIDVMKELPATLVLRPFNSDTLAVVAYQLARDERLGEAAVPSLALVVLGLIPVILVSRSLSKPSQN
ncbi:MAG: iron ABC transporter permease [Burkholderiaceae bacterium]|jgi:iron(III) transport system permease protein|nr:iron ABC transporter permease [Burkholderiaceae bacterium]MDP4861742.1 iron ABC transporter permease [Burkholderiaceae bacterium]